MTSTYTASITSLAPNQNNALNYDWAYQISKDGAQIETGTLTQNAPDATGVTTIIQSKINSYKNAEAMAALASQVPITLTVS